jgi:spermidine synthase
VILTLVAVFVLSGAAGLIYESIWSRYLGLFVGHSAYAQIIVLVVFLGGMSLGAHVVSRRSATIRAPLFVYGVVELLIGVVALLFHRSFVAVSGAAYATIFPALSGVALVVVKWLLASVLILPQSVLLGATFPLMSAGVIRLARRVDGEGRLLALLYFANSLGAAAGVLFAGLVLVEVVGLPGTLLVAALINVVVGIVAVIVSQIARSSWTAASAIPVPVAAARPPIAYASQLLWVTFGTAVASFIYEIAWIRMLSLVLGSATHSFEIMLSAFILGLALGSWWIRSRADLLEDPVQYLGILQWAMGLLAVATLPLYLASFDWMSTFLAMLQHNDEGYRLFELCKYLIASVIMLPATFCAGTTLPLITRMLMHGEDGERAIGKVYAVNTLGSIVGVVLAGLILMPALGLKRLLVAGAIIDIALGVWLVVARLRDRSVVEDREPGQARARTRRWSSASGAMAPLTLPIVATAVLLVAIALGARFDLARITSGVYRHGVVPPSRDYAFPFYKDGRTATVSLRRDADGFTTIATNGKPDASMDRVWIDSAAAPATRELTLTRDISTQFLLPIIALAHAPRARDAAVIGHGSGMSSHVLLGSPYFRQVVTIEIEPEMIHASRGFYPANRRVFDDPRSLEVVDDAKSYFASSGRKFDLILSEPSNPWVSGVSGLFTREFYARVKHQLAPHGVFGQWLHLYELNDQLVTSVLAAIDREFRAYDVYFTSNSDILIVASNTALPTPDWSVTGFPGVAHDLRHALPLDQQTFESLHLGGRDVLHPMLLADGYVNSDFFPILDLGAERLRFAHANAEGYETLSEGRFDVVAALMGRRAGFGDVAYSPTPEIPRANARALGSRIQELRTAKQSVIATLPIDDELSKAMYRIDALERMIAVHRPPANWHSWVSDVVAVDEDIHGGTAGVADTAFFARLRAFAQQPGAPVEARASVDFLHGISVWNWREAADAGDTLLHSQDADEWLPDTLLYNGAIVARLKLGELAQAKEILRIFARKANEQQFQERLLAAYVAFSDPESRKKLHWR